MSHYYESGGVKPFAQYLQDTQNKCAECGHIWVGPRSYHCPSCIIDMERKENGHAPYQAH